MLGCFLKGHTEKGMHLIYLISYPNSEVQFKAVQFTADIAHTVQLPEPLGIKSPTKIHKED